MTYNGIYTVDLNSYKDLKIDIIFSRNSELRMIAREIIYYIHYSNLIMNLFLSSNENIENLLDKISIISLDDYMNGSDLIKD